MIYLNVWIIRIHVCVETNDKDLRWRYWHAGNHDHHICRQLSNKINATRK